MRDAQVLAGLFGATKPKRRVSTKPRKKTARIGAKIEVYGKEYKLLERDTNFATAWYVEDTNGNCMPYSISRDMFRVL